jgi:hypothetical protein
MAVEVKTELTIEDIKDHGKRLEILRGYADAHQDHRIYLGAVAGGVLNDSVRGYALKTGFYVIEPSGDSAIIKAPDTVKVW